MRSIARGSKTIVMQVTRGGDLFHRLLFLMMFTMGRDQQAGFLAQHLVQKEKSQIFVQKTWDSL